MTYTVLITGCSSGLGRATAERFAAEGWNVVATMRKPDPVVAAPHPDRILVAALDVADEASIAAAFAAGLRRFGRIDAVINNAGVSVLSLFESASAEAVRRIFDTNVFGLMNVTRAAIPALRAAGGGTIVNVSSGAGFMAVPLLSLYVASKYAVEGFSESLAYELESQAIRVRLVEPGVMRNTRFAESTMAASAGAGVPPEYKAYFDHALAAMLDYPFPATPEEAVVDAIWRAATDASPRLRYPVGPDIAEYARLRWSTSEDEYRAGMSRLVGQARWREERDRAA